MSISLAEYEKIQIDLIDAKKKLCQQDGKILLLTTQLEKKNSVVKEKDSKLNEMFKLIESKEKEVSELIEALNQYEQNEALNMGNTNNTSICAIPSPLLPPLENENKDIVQDFEPFPFPSTIFEKIFSTDTKKEKTPKQIHFDDNFREPSIIMTEKANETFIESVETKDLSMVSPEQLKKLFQTFTVSPHLEDDKSRLSLIQNESTLTTPKKKEALFPPKSPYSATQKSEKNLSSASKMNISKLVDYDSFVSEESDLDISSYTLESSMMPSPENKKSSSTNRLFEMKENIIPRARPIMDISMSSTFSTETFQKQLLMIRKENQAIRSKIDSFKGKLHVIIT